ncbi:hypothetical protein Scep_015072 [Stephania cephalantha]|uniref:Secreted protein n=1 Tax=Stephania cephalantha TaxID=152367 RepID=A0AAP0J538_9MAGN
MLVLLCCYGLLFLFGKMDGGGVYIWDSGGLLGRGGEEAEKKKKRRHSSVLGPLSSNAATATYLDGDWDV